MTAPAAQMAQRSATGGKFLPHHVAPAWLPADLAAGLLHHAIENEARFRAGSLVHSGKIIVDPSIRQTSVLDDVGLGPFLAPLVAAALAAQPALATRFGMPHFTASNVEVEMAAHGDGAHFNSHIDTFVAVNKRPNPRLLTLVLYLNRLPCGFSGGALRLHALGSAAFHDIMPEHNKLVAFPSITRHSVQPISCPSAAFADRRFAVNMWLHG